MNYSKLYRNHVYVWGSAPNKLLLKVIPGLRKEGKFLDLGCGQGRDSLYMLENGFQVTSVDQAQSGLDVMKKSLPQDPRLHERLHLVCANLETYAIEPASWDIINVINVLHLLSKETAHRLIREIIHGIKQNGFVIISGFTIEDPGFKKPHQQTMGYFGKDELSKLFSMFTIIFYEETIVDDPGHPGNPEPHTHGIVRMIAKKI